MKTTNLSLVTVTALAIILSACGKKSENAAAPAPAPATAPKAATPNTSAAKPAAVPSAAKITSKADLLTFIRNSGFPKDEVSRRYAYYYGTQEATSVLGIDFYVNAGRTNDIRYRQFDGSKYQHKFACGGDALCEKQKLIDYLSELVETSEAVISNQRVYLTSADGMAQYTFDLNLPMVANPTTETRKHGEEKITYYFYSGWVSSSTTTQYFGATVLR